MVTKQVRFEMFIERLAVADSANSMNGAHQLLSRVLNEVEDELTDIPFSPENYISDGRMYPPQEDSRRDVKCRDDIIRYRSKEHNTYVSKNGAILILGINGIVYLNKSGSDGKGITL